MFAFFWENSFCFVFNGCAKKNMNWIFIYMYSKVQREKLNTNEKL